jgi:hypothetical protein
MFSASPDGGAPMSADERPLHLEKREPKDRLETGWRCRRRRNEGLAPVREEIGSKRVRPKKADVIFLRSARFCLARPSAQ